MSRSILFYSTLNSLLLAVLVACGGSETDPTPIDPPEDINLPVYANPAQVNIAGYSGDAMEPYLSADGNLLFFNNLNAAMLSNGEVNDTNLHYATRIDDLNFTYIGPVIGANIDLKTDVNELEGVASLDRSGKFYFVRTIDYMDPNSPDYLRSLYSADFSAGSVTNLQSISNLKFDREATAQPQLGELNFDAEIHRDGNILYFVQGIFSGNPFPDEANIGIARKTANDFVVDDNSETLFAAINTDDLEYAPAISDDQLTLFFTRASGSILLGFEFGIYFATRDSVNDAWGNVTKISAIDGELTEGPTVSADGSLVYYHQKVNGIFKIYAVTRQL